MPLKNRNIGPADLNFPRLIQFVTFAGTLLVILALPLGYFSLGYRSRVSTLETTAQIKAEIITQLIAISPEMWRFEELRMTELLTRHPVVLRDERAEILDEAGTVLVAVGEAPAWPVLVRSVGLFDSGNPVGHLEIQQSLRPLLLHTAGTGLLGLLLGVALFTLDRVQHFATELRQSASCRPGLAIYSRSSSSKKNGWRLLSTRSVTRW